MAGVEAVRASEAGNGGGFDPSELVCGGCSAGVGETVCSKHGPEFIEFKCKFCCGVANWYCWGNTHFCDECHRKQVWQSTSASTHQQALDLPPPSTRSYCLSLHILTCSTYCVHILTQMNGNYMTRKKPEQLSQCR